MSNLTIVLAALLGFLLVPTLFRRLPAPTERGRQEVEETGSIEEVWESIFELPKQLDDDDKCSHVEAVSGYPGRVRHVSRDTQVVPDLVVQRFNFDPPYSYDFEQISGWTFDPTNKLSRMACGKALLEADGDKVRIVFLSFIWRMTWLCKLN